MKEGSLNNGTNGDARAGRLAFLKQKIEADKAALAAEMVKHQKAKAKLQAREWATVGEALCKYAAENPDFHLMLKQVLQSAVTDDAARKFLAGRGWAS